MGGFHYGVVLRGGRAPVRSRDRRRAARLLWIFRASKAEDISWSNTPERVKRRRYILSHFVTLPLARAEQRSALNTLCAPERERVPCRIRRYVRIVRSSRGGAGLFQGRCSARAQPPRSLMEGAQAAATVYVVHKRDAGFAAARPKRERQPADGWWNAAAEIRGQLLREA